MKSTYAVQADHTGDGAFDRWVTIGGVEAESLSFCLGYVSGLRDSWPPHRGLRIRRSDGKIMEVWKPVDEVSVGMVAGFPTPEQYEHAAREALEKAAQIREGVFRGGRSRPLPPPRSAMASVAERTGVTKCRHCKQGIWRYEIERLCETCQPLFDQGVGVGRAIEIRKEDP